MSSDKIPDKLLMYELKEKSTLERRLK